MTEFLKIIEDERIKRKITSLNEWAELIGISAPSYHNYVKGKFHPNSRMAKIILQNLEMETADMQRIYRESRWEYLKIKGRNA